MIEYSCSVWVVSVCVCVPVVFDEGWRYGRISEAAYICCFPCAGVKNQKGGERRREIQMRGLARCTTHERLCWMRRSWEIRSRMGLKTLRFRSDSIPKAVVIISMYNPKQLADLARDKIDRSITTRWQMFFFWIHKERQYRKSMKLLGVQTWEKAQITEESIELRKD